jgi:DNA-binding HxlR family transcriptional regulator
VGGISQKMLTQTLRKLERDGLVTRHVYPEVPPRTEYELTKLGHTLIEPMGALCEWAGAHLSELEQARKRYDNFQKKASLSA